MKQLLFLIFFVSAALLQGQSGDTIIWRESYKLTWNDFKAPPDQSSPIGALTGASILYDAESKGNSITCKVICYFDRQRSWVKNDKRLDYVLHHEQGHFDLYEIYSRKLRKILSEKTFNRKTLTSDLKKTINQVIAKSTARQKKYDKATGFAFNVSKQNKWTKAIADELKDLEKYKGVSVTLSVK